MLSANSRYVAKPAGMRHAPHQKQLELSAGRFPHGVLRPQALGMSPELMHHCRGKNRSFIREIGRRVIRNSAGTIQC